MWTTDDHVTDREIKTLHPLIRGLVYKGVMQLLEQGIFCRVYEGYRSEYKQNKLFNSGKSKVRGGGSFHQYGLAFDCVKIENKVARWNDYKEISKVFRLLGFDWGYEMWGWDKPHFQMTFNYFARELKDLPVDDEGFVILETERFLNIN